MNLLVTGVTGGLGSVFCDSQIVKGNRVMGIYRNQKKIEKMPFWGNMNFIPIIYDLTTLNNNEELVIQIKNNIRHVVFCHAVCTQKDFLTLTQEDLEYSMQINFMSTFVITQKIIQEWKKLNDGIDRSITFVSSVATVGGSEVELAYHSSKRAAESIMLSVARGFASNKIRANVISPGLMDTPMGRETIKNRPDVLERIPLHKLVTTNEAVQLIELLMSSTSITGQNIHINNGRYLSI